MGHAYRCSTCGVDWPNTSRFSRCPACGEKSDLIGNGSPIPMGDAMSKARHLEFERFYDQRDRGRKGPSPEEKGRAEAQAIIELERQLGEGI